MRKINYSDLFYKSDEQRQREANERQQREATQQRRDAAKAKLIKLKIKGEAVQRELARLQIERLKRDAEADPEQVEARSEGHPMMEFPAPHDAAKFDVQIKELQVRIKEIEQQQQEINAAEQRRTEEEQAKARRDAEAEAERQRLQAEELTAEAKRQPLPSAPPLQIHTPAQEEQPTESKQQKLYNAFARSLAHKPSDEVRAELKLRVNDDSPNGKHKINAAMRAYRHARKLSHTKQTANP